jgi:hypothetical protein
MQLKNDKVNMAIYLYCHSILEDKVADAFSNLSERTNNSSLKPFLLYISQDSKKHSVILKGLSNLIGRIDPDRDICRNSTSITYRKMITLAEDEQMKRQILKDSEVPSIAQKMSRLESFFAEEYLLPIRLGILPVVAPEIDLERFQMIIEWIIEDEERHEAILRNIGNYFNTSDMK